jgi:hypothetical protein
LSEDFDWKDFSIIRIPYDLVPPGFMDIKAIERQKHSSNKLVFDMEYGAVFVSDSNGFFKRSAIEAATTNNPIQLVSGPVQFNAVMKGNRAYDYVYGIDPASESDNLAIVVLELHSDHVRIVHCWTTNKKTHLAKVKKNETPEHDYYRYCARKVRDLMRTFPPVAISIDSGGGGLQLREALGDPKELKDNERPLLPIQEGHQLWNEKETQWDGMVGDHILEMVQFSNAAYVAEANHGLKKDILEKFLLFPAFDAVAMANAAVELEQNEKGVYEATNRDTLDDCMLEIEELKNELCSIVLSVTGVSGREHWDTPDTKISGSEKGKQRKDRYSALLIANMAARRMNRTPVQEPYRPSGGLVGGFKGKSDQLYTGPDWFTNKSNYMVGKLVRRDD